MKKQTFTIIAILIALAVTALYVIYNQDSYEFENHSEIPR